MTVPACPPVLRAGTDADGPGFRALIAACWGEYTPEFTDVAAEIPEIDRLATDTAGRGGALWAAAAGGAVVGMVATYPAADGWHLSRLYVAASARGTGLAADLLRRAEDHARAAGADRMVLWSDTLFTRAHAFYGKHGYLRRGGLRPLGNPAGSIEARFAKPLTGRVVEACDVAAAESAERPLAAMLRACVATGRVPGFLPGLGPDAALAYWQGVTRDVGRGRAHLFASWRNGTLSGTVQLRPDPREDGRHRAELRTMLVAPGSRCRGVARRLLEAAEVAAHADGRRLLLMALPADEHGATFHRDAGWREAGTVPGFFDAPEHPSSEMSIWYKLL